MIVVPVGGEASDPNEGNFTIGYTQCEAGSRQDPDGLACISCVAGTYSAVEGSSECSSCLFGLFQPAEGQSTCEQCPANAVSITNAMSIPDFTSCECKKEFYAIPFGDFSLFQTLDSEAYNIYRENYIDTTVSVSFDPNQNLRNIH